MIHQADCDQFYNMENLNIRLNFSVGLFSCPFLLFLVLEIGVQQACKYTRKQEIKVVLINLAIIMYNKCMQQDMLAICHPT